MNKSEIRKKISKIRKHYNYKNLNIDLKDILEVFKKKRINRKVIGGYYPYNYEVDIIKILEKFEKLEYKI